MTTERIARRRRRGLLAAGVVVALIAALGVWWLVRPPFQSEWKDAAQDFSGLSWAAHSAVPDALDQVATMPPADNDQIVAGRVSALWRMVNTQSWALEALKNNTAAQRDGTFRALLEEMLVAHDRLMEQMSVWEEQGYDQVAWMTIQCRAEPSSAGCTRAVADLSAVDVDDEFLAPFVSAAASGPDAAALASAQAAFEAHCDSLADDVIAAGAAVDAYLYTKLTP